MSKMNFNSRIDTRKPQEIALDFSPLPRPRLTWRGVLIAAVLWALHSLISAIPLQTGARIPFFWAFTGQLYSSATMALLSIPIWLFIIRGMDEKRWIWKVLVHILIAPLYAVVIYKLYYLFVYYLTDGKGAAGIASASQWIMLYNLLLYAVQFSIYHGVQIFRKLKFNEQQMLTLMALKKEQELAALKSQINPHFFFNTLNGISAMAVRNPEATRTMIAQLGDLLRYALDMSKKDFVPLNNEVEFIKSYLALEAKRLSDRLRIEYNIQTEALNFPVPPMILQPLVENAIKHGIEPSENGGTVSISIAIEQKKLRVVVKDTGIGFKAAPLVAQNNGVGLKNIDARLQKLFGEEHGLQTHAPESGGFVVSFSIPLQKEIRP